MPPKDRKIIAFFLGVTAMALVSLWIAQYLFLIVQPTVSYNNTTYVFQFDRIAVVPDLILIVLLFITAAGYMKEWKSARPFSIVCAIYLVFLGVVDWPLKVNGLRYAVSIVDAMANGAINLWCIVLGLYLILKQRKKAHRPVNE